MIYPDELDNVHETIDIDVAPPSEYPVNEPLKARLLPEGIYTLKLARWAWETDRESKQPNFRKLNLTLEVVGGDQDGKKARNLAVWTTPWTDPRTGKKRSGLGDLINAIDATREWHGVEGASSILNEALDKGTEFRAKLVWEAYDDDYFTEHGGRDMTPKSPEQKLLRKASTIKGMRFFPRSDDGHYEQEIEGPSGAKLEAKLTVGSFYTSRR